MPPLSGGPIDLLPLLCHPYTHEPLSLSQRGLSSPRGDFFPLYYGIPSFVTSRSPWQHRMWGWVYNRVAFGYDFGVRFGWRLALGGAPIRRESYLEKIHISPGELVLEAAVGTGANISRLPAHGRYIGLDISMGMLRKCRSRVPSSHPLALVHGDMHAMPFRTGCFDAAFHMGGLQFLTDPAAAVMEIYRVLRPGGTAWLVDETYALPKIASRTRGAGLAGTALLEKLAPPGGTGVHAEMINKGELYFLSFRKPL